jgi:hypothetical protein
MTDTDGVFLEEDLIQINKFSHLHNGKTIIFCKTDFILQEFQNIRNLNNEVIFITGNSDYCITDGLVDKAPKNIKTWFCQNKLSNNPLLVSIPLGIENTVECAREGHGYVWPHALEKPSKLLSGNKMPTKEVYANFNVSTNYEHRTRIRDLIKSGLCEHITWEEPNLSYDQFIASILDHKAVVCAQGNGPGDNHRIYETLYLGRVPLTFNKVQYDILHNNFPVLLIEDMQDLTNHEILIKKMNSFKLNKEVLKFEYWKNIITNEEKKCSSVR